MSLTIRVGLLLCFAAIAGLMILMAAGGVVATQSIRGAQERIVNETIPAVVTAKQIANQAQSLSVTMANVRSAASLEDVEASKRSVQATEAEIDQSLRTLSGLVDDQSEIAAFESETAAMWGVIDAFSQRRPAASK